MNTTTIPNDTKYYPREPYELSKIFRMKPGQLKSIRFTYSYKLEQERKMIERLNYKDL